MEVQKCVILTEHLPARLLFLDVGMLARTSFYLCCATAHVVQLVRLLLDHGASLERRVNLRNALVAAADYAGNIEVR